VFYLSYVICIDILIKCILIYYHTAIFSMIFLFFSYFIVYTKFGLYAGITTAMWYLWYKQYSLWRSVWYILVHMSTLILVHFSTHEHLSIVTFEYIWTHHVFEHFSTHQYWYILVHMSTSVLVHFSTHCHMGTSVFVHLSTYGHISFDTFEYIWAHQYWYMLVHIVTWAHQYLYIWVHMGTSVLVHVSTHGHIGIDAF